MGCLLERVLCSVCEMRTGASLRVICDLTLICEREGVVSMVAEQVCESLDLVVSD